MPAIQTTYPSNIPAALVGQVADMRAAVIRSVEVEAATLAFGVPVAQGTADRQGRLFTTGDTVTDFIGASVRQRSVLEGDTYTQRESAGVLTKGPIWVTASVQVAAGDPVAVTSAGAWSNVAGANGIVVPNGRWDTSTSGAAQLAKLVLG